VLKTATEHGLNGQCCREYEAVMASWLREDKTLKIFGGVQHEAATPPVLFLWLRHEGRSARAKARSQGVLTVRAFLPSL